jgi:hypothetical protein
MYQVPQLQEVSLPCLPVAMALPELVQYPAVHSSPERELFVVEWERNVWGVINTAAWINW